VRTSVCLNMIVRESDPTLIERCIRSALPVIDCWAIIDTGCSPEVLDKLVELLAHLPGRLQFQEWTDFSTARNQAIELARTLEAESRAVDFLLLLDADEELVLEPGASVPPRLWPGGGLLDCYRVRSYTRRVGGTSHMHRKVIRLAKPWRWEGVVHEALDCAEPFTESSLPGWSVVGRFDSARNQQSDSEKYGKDAELLLRSFADDPSNGRTVYYLARSLEWANRPEEALKWHHLRRELDGFWEERWDSLYRIALIHDAAGRHAEAVAAYLDAYQEWPRAEPLYRLAKRFRLRDQFRAALMFSGAAVACERPDANLWVEDDVYTWRAKDEFSVASYWAGDLQQGLRTCLEVLGTPGLPLDAHERADENRLAFIRKIERTKDR
jgi:hypothetical protein